MNAENNKDRSSIGAATSSISNPTRTVVLAENRIDSRQLFGAVKEITIAHGDDVYRLRLTSQNKLILTK